LEIQLTEKSTAPVRYFAAAIVCVFFGVSAIFAAANLSFSTPHAVPEPTIIDSAVSTESRDGRLAVFDDVWQTVFDRYYIPRLEASIGSNSASTFDLWPETPPEPLSYIRYCAKWSRPFVMHTPG